MKEVTLSLNGKRYSFTDLRNWKRTRGSSSFEESTLSFCRDWISGKESFTVPTSGSTGTPKEIILQRAAMEESAQRTIEVLGLKAGDHSLLCLDTRFIAGQMMLVRSFAAGMNIIAVEPSANPLGKVGADTKIDFAAVVPNQLIEMMRSDAGRLNAIKTIIVGGAPVDHKLSSAVEGLKTKVYATYGMTETVSHIALQKLNGTDAQEFFQVLPRISIELDERACLTIKAAYLGVDKIITNDRVELLSADRFRWLGRWDRMINSGGIKVAPEKVEAVCASEFEILGLSNRFFVAGVPDEKLGQKVVLVVEGINKAPELVERVLDKLRGNLGKYEVPREVLFVRNFVETSTQKIDQEATLRLA